LKRTIDAGVTSSVITIEARTKGQEEIKGKVQGIKNQGLRGRDPDHKNQEIKDKAQGNQETKVQETKKIGLSKIKDQENQGLKDRIQRSQEIKDQDRKDQGHHKNQGKDKVQGNQDLKGQDQTLLQTSKNHQRRKRIRLYKSNYIRPAQQQAFFMPENLPVTD
jgi:hypothetical protein